MGSDGKPDQVRLPQRDPRRCLRKIFFIVDLLINPVAVQTESVHRQMKILPASDHWGSRGCGGGHDWD